MDVNSRDPSQNIIPFRIKGVDIAQFDICGNLGIGTTAPTAKLDIAGGVKISSGATIGGNTVISGTLNIINNSGETGITLNGIPIENKINSAVIINMDSQPAPATALNRQKKQSIPLAAASTLSTSDVVAKMSGVSVGKTQTYGVGPGQMASYGNIVVAVGNGTNSIAYSLTNPPTASSWIGIPNSANTFTTQGRNIAYANGTWVAVGEGTNSIAYSTMTPPVASSWVGIPNNISFNSVSTRNTFSVGWDIAYGNGAWVAVGGETNSIAYSLANPPTAESWVGITINSSTNFGTQGSGITFGNGTWVATGSGTNGIAYSTRTPPTSDSWIVVPLTNSNDAGVNNTPSTWNVNVTYANGVWLAAGFGTNTLCYSIENPPIASSWMPITTSVLFGTASRSVAYGNGTWVACGDAGTLLAYSTSRIPHTSSWVAMKGPTALSASEVINHITFNTATNTWYFMGDISSNCMFYSTQTPPVPASWVGIQRSTGTFSTLLGQAFGLAGITTNAFTSPVNVARLDNKVTFPANRMLAVGGGGSGADVLARSSNTPAPATTGTISYSDDDGATWQMVPGGATNSMFSSVADIAANTSFGVGGSQGANAVAWNGEKWVAAGNGRTNSLAFSDDGGMTWTGITGKSIFSVEARDVVWNGQMWVAVGRGAVFSTAYSYDGVTWMGPVDASGAPINVFSFDIAGPNAAMSDISGGGNRVTWTGKMWVAAGTRTLIAGSSPAAYYTVAYSTDGKTWTGVPESGATSTGFDMYAYDVAWNGRNYIATGRGTTNTLVNFTDVSGASWQGLGNTVFSVWGRGVTWGAKRWMATGRGTNTVAYSTNGRNWQGCGANVFKPLRRFMAMGDTGLYTGVSSGQPQRGVAFTYSDDGVTWDAPVVNQAVEFSTPIGGTGDTTRSVIFTNQMLLSNVITDTASQHTALMYSTDAGASWMRVPGTSDTEANGGIGMTPANNGSYSLTANTARTRFLVSGGDSASATKKVYFSNDGFNWRNGVSSPNATQFAWVWASLWVGGGYNRWLIGGIDVTTQSNGRIMYSGDADAVAQWIAASPATYTEAVISCFAANTDFSVILAGAASGNTIYRSVNGGETWSQQVLSVISNIVASYNFDSNLNDSSPNNNTLTNQSSVSWNTTNFKRGTASALFNGSNYFEISNDGRFSPDNFSVACWVRPVDSAGIYQAIASCRTLTSGWVIYISPSNNLEFWTGNSTGFSGGGIGLYSNFVTLNTWIHIAFTLNKTTRELIVYINGIATTITTRDYSNNTGTNLRIGAGVNEGGAGFHIKSGSLIDDFRFYNKVLTPFEISSISEVGGVRSISFSPSLGRWVAVGSAPISGYNIIYSTDATATAWIAPPAQAKTAATAIFKNGSEATRVIWDALNGGRFIIGGWNGGAIITLSNVAGADGVNNNPGYTMAYSADGINWTPVTVRSSDDSGVGIGASTFGPFLTQCRDIMALDTAGDFTPVNTGYSITWNSYANRFIATGNGTTPVVYSNDGGVTWTPANQQPQQQAIAIAGGLGAAAGAATVSHITYTIDGKTWSQGIGAKEIFGTGAVNAVKYGQTSTAVSPNGRIWVAGGTHASGTSCLAFSQNGIRWSAITNATALITNVRTITYAPVEQMSLSINAATTAGSGVGNGVWIAGGDTTNSLIFSYDGISWSEVPNSLTILSRCNACAFGNGLFVAGGVAATGTSAIDTTAVMAYSTDGLIWKPIRSSSARISAGASIGSITYGRDENGRGLWVAGATGSTTISLLYSYNGIDWIGVVNSGTTISSIGVTSIAYGVRTTTGQGLWVATVNRSSTDGNAFVFSTNGRDGWTAVPNTKTQLFDVSGGGATSITYMNGVWYATGTSSGISGGRTLAYSYEGSSGWFGVYPTTNMYGSALTTFSITDMRCVATTNDYMIPCGASAGVATSSGTAAASFGPSSLVPVRNIGWTAGVGSAYLQHPTLLFGADGVSKGGAISADGGRTWGASTVSLSSSAFRGGVCNDAFWNGTFWGAVGYDATTGAKLATSKDGVTWSQANIPITGVLNTITWNGSVWMVGGDGSPINDANTESIAWSPDLVTWNGIINTDISLTVVKRIAWNGMYWVAVGQGGVSNSTTIMYSKNKNGLVWEDTFTAASSTAKTSTITTAVNDVVWGGGRWVAVGRGNSVAGGAGVSILYSVDTPAAGADAAEYAITGRRWTGVTASAQLFPYGANSVSWNGKRFIATGPASASCSTSNIIAWSADGISWNAYSSAKTVAPGQRWVAVGSGSRACIALSADGRVWTDVVGSAALFSDISGATAALVNTMKTGARAVGWNGSSLIVGGARSATTTTAASQATATSTNGRTTIPVCAFIGSGNGVMGGGTTNSTNAATHSAYTRVSSSVFITHMDVNMREALAPWANMWLNTYTDLSASQLFQVTPETQTFSSALKWNGWSWVANFGMTTNNPITGEQYGSIWYCTDPLARVGWSVASNSVNPRILIGQGGYAALEWNGVAWLACGCDPNNNSLIYTTDKYGAVGWTAVSGIVSGGSASFQPVCIASSSRFWVVGGAQGTTSALYYTNDRTGATGWRAITTSTSVLPGIRISSVGYNGAAWICCGGGGGGSDAPASSISWRADADDIGAGWAAATISADISGGIPPVLANGSAVLYNTGASTQMWVVVGDVTSDTGNQIAYTTTPNGSNGWKIPTGTLTNTLFGRLNGIAWTGYSWIATSGAGAARLMSTMDITAASGWNSSPTNSIYTPTLCTNAVTFANIPISLLTTGMVSSAGVGAGSGAMWRGGVGRAQGLLPGGGTETTSVIARSSNGAEGTTWSQVYSRNFLIAVGGGVIRDASGGGGTNRMAYSYDGGLSWTTNNTSVLTNAAGSSIGSIRTVKYSNGIWVAGGDAAGSSVSGNNCLAWSRDGVNWVGAGGTQIFGSAGACYAVCCNDRGRWVAVGGSPLTTSGTYTNATGSIYTMAWSDDGMNWTPVLASRALFGIVCQGVSYGADAAGVGMWTAIGRGSAYTGLAYSYDAKNWFLSQTSASLFGTSVNVLTERYGSMSSVWAVAMNSTGQYQSAVVNNGFIYTSLDYGVTWTAKESSRGWEGISVSSTGQYQSAVVNNGFIYTSLDYGVTWTAKESSREWRGISVSSTGQYQSAVVKNGFIYRSSDYGVTWTARNSSRDWSGISISSTGQYQTAIPNGAQINISSDYGLNWTATDLSSNWRGISISSTGQYQTATVDSFPLRTSSNYGVTWGNADAVRGWKGVSVSSTGQYQTALHSNGKIYTSLNYGGNWSPMGDNQAWRCICVSSTGQYQTVGMDGGLIYISSNFGETWSSAATDSRSLGITYGKNANGTGMWVATAGRRDRDVAASAANTMAYSYDGKLWRGITAAAGLSEQAWSVAYGKDGFGVGMWVAAGYDRSCGLKWSYDGITWNASAGASGAAIWTSMAAGRRALSVYWNGSMWLASTSDTRNGSPSGTGIAANNASSIPGYLLYSYNGKNWLPVLAPNTYDATISTTAQPSVYSVLPNPAILDFGSFYDDQTQRGTMIANTTAQTVGAVMSNVPIENVNTIVPYGKGSLTTGQVPFLIGGDSGLVTTPVESPLYAFSAHKFTNAGATGREGPELDTVITTYMNAGASWARTYLNMTTRGIQEWTVPATGSYTIRAAGASGSGSGGTPGKGIVLEITTTLIRDEVIFILVGQKPETQSEIGQGGGGTFIVRGSITNPIPILVSGGGGGAGERNTSNINATSSSSGRAGGEVMARATDSKLGAGGINGNGGGSGGTSFPRSSSGGGGLYTSGVEGRDLLNTNGKSFVSGGLGGGAGINIFNTSSFVDGGFGGGAGSQLSSSYPGGGGGYSGGGGGGYVYYIQSFWGSEWLQSNDNYCGGGGGSYGISNLTTIGDNTGHGSVTITPNFTIIPTFPIPTFPITSELAASTASLSTSTDGGVSWRAVPNSTKVMTKVNKILCDESTQQIVAVGTGNYSVATSTPAKAADADGWTGVFGSRMTNTRTGLFEKYGTGASWFGGAKMWIASGRAQTRRGSSLAVSVNGTVWQDAKIVSQTAAGAAGASRGGGLVSRTTTSLATAAVGMNSQDGASAANSVIVVPGNALYEFSGFTFDTGGKFGEFGPTKDQLMAQSNYSSASWTTTYLTVSTGIQKWTVPATGSYTIRAVGAGVPYNSSYTTNNQNQFQKGMDVTQTYDLTKNDVIQILVGQHPVPMGSGNKSAGGAGGTFVFTGISGAYVPIIIAGGGGGRGDNRAAESSNAQSTYIGGNGDGDSDVDEYHRNTYGKSELTNTTDGGLGTAGTWSNGGGGWVSSGYTSTQNTISRAGYGVQANYGLGGTGNGSTNGPGTGGFGGGAGSFGYGGGGGGGFCGGGGGGYYNYPGSASGNSSSGGGGGSYSRSGSFTSASANNNGNGYVTITANFPVYVTSTTGVNTPQTSYPLPTPGGIVPYNYLSMTHTTIPYTSAATPLLTYTDSAAAFSTQVSSVATNSQYNRAVVGGSGVQFVAGGRGTGSNSSGLAYSNDGQNWTAAAAGAATVFQSPTNVATYSTAPLSGGFDANFGTVALTQRLTVPATYPSGIWRSVSLSKTGQYQSALVNGGNIWTSSDYGVTWTERTTGATRNWCSISVSSTGQYQSALVNGGNIWTSSDYGVTWTDRTTGATRNWAVISLSSTGQYQSASVYSGFIWVSSDYGVSWLPRATSFFWRSVSISSTGQYQSAVTHIVDGGKIWTSSDFGVSWSVALSGLELYGISLSSTGQYQTALPNGGNIRTSSDYGVSWTERTTGANRDWNTVSLSSTGQYQSAVVYGGNIWTSSDFGVTWTARTTPGTANWNSISLSSTGQYQTAAVYGGNIFTSTNYGITWVQCSTAKKTNAFTRIRSSASGQYQIATAGPAGNANGQFYVSTDYGQTWMPRRGLGSWLGGTVSGTGAVMMTLFTLPVKRWTFTKLQDGDGVVNFLPIPTNNSVSLHFNIRSTTNVTVFDVNINGDWSLSPQITASDIHNLPNLSTIYFSFDTVNGWKIDYTVSGVAKSVTIPNRLSITSIDNINNTPFSDFGTKATITGPDDLNRAILRSTDYGNTFSDIGGTALSGSAYWRAIAATNSASVQTAVANGGSIYRSFDTGLSWPNAGITIDGDASANTITPRNWQDVAVSAETGTYQLTCNNGGYIYYSTNKGDTWTSSSVTIDEVTPQATNRTWQAVANSANGQYALACVNSTTANGYIYRSVNYGASWSSTDISINGVGTQTTNRAWQDVGMSANGKYQVACVGSSEYIYYSKNYGASWTPLIVAGARAWSSVALSENGSTISATTSDSTGAIFTYTMPDDQYYRPALLANSGTTTTTSSIRAITYGNSGTGAATDGYWVAGADAASNSLAYSSNGMDWTPVVRSKTTLFNTVNGVAYGADTNGTPLWVAVGAPFVGSVPGATAYSIAYSYNMTTWIGVRNLANFTGQGNHVTYGQDEFGAGMWVAVGQGDGVLAANLGNSSFGNSNGTPNTTIFYSYDGANWAAATGSGVFSTSGTDVTWGVDASGVATWVATGVGYTDPLTGVFIVGGQVAHSTDGRVWTPIRTPTAILSPITTPLSATTRGSAMIAPPALKTGFIVPTYNNIWRMLGQDIDGEAATDESGFSVSMSADGTIVAIGAQYNDAGGISTDNRGHVRVYKYNPNKTVAQNDQTLPGFGPAGWDRLGGDIDGEEDATDADTISVSLSADGTIVAIGASKNDGSFQDAGHVRVYKYRAGKTQPQLSSSDPTTTNDFGPAGWDRLGGDIDGEASDDRSGTSVSLSADGTVVAIGANLNNGTASDAGQVRVYKYNSTKTTTPVKWEQLGADIDGELPDDRSGCSTSLSADGTVIAIGAFKNDGTTGTASDIRGHVRVYKYTPGKGQSTVQTDASFGPAGWTRLGADIDGEAAGDNSGYSVSISADGNVIAIGGRFNDGSGNEIPNAIYLRTGGSNWRDFVPLLTANTTTNLQTWTPDSQFNESIDAANQIAKQFAYFAGYWLNRTRASSGQSYSIPAFAGQGSVGTFTFTATSNYPVTSYSGNLTGYNGTTYTLTAQTDGNTAGQNVAFTGDIGHVRVYRYNSAKAAAQLNQGLSGFGPVGWDRLGGDIDGEAAGDNSGYSVSLSADGTIVAIGAIFNDGQSTSTTDDRGHVRVYKYNPAKTAAITDQTLPNFGPAGWDRIGVDIDGEAPSDQSGWSVSLSADGTTLAIGANGNDATGNSAGHLRVYKLDTYGAITYTSSNPSVAYIYGNALLLINDISDGVTTITATQAAVPPFTLSPITVQGTLTVSGKTTRTLVYNTIVSTYTPFSTSALTVAYGRGGSQGSGVPRWIVGGSGTNVFAISSRPSATTGGTWSVVASNDAAAPFTVCNSLGYSNGIWVAGNNTDATNVLARSTDGGTTWTPVTLSSVGGVIAGATAVGANAFCNYSLAYADYSSDTNLRSWVAVQGTKNFMFEGGVNTVATVSSNINASAYNGMNPAWWVAGGVGASSSGVSGAALACTTAPSGATGWTKSTSSDIANLASINDVAFSPHTQRWLAVGAGAAGSPNTNVLYSDAFGTSWNASSVTVLPGVVIIPTTASAMVAPPGAVATTYGSWNRLGTTDISGVDAGERSGESVILSADGTTVAIGAPNNNSGKGVTRIHKLTGNVWTRLGTTDISGVDVNEQSGISVSLSADGTTVAIGAYGNNSYTGVTRIHKLTGNVWTRLGTTDISGVDVNEQSGKSVSLSADGTTVAIGAFGNNSYTGVTRIHKLTGNVWTRLGTTDISGVDVNEQSGKIVSLSADGTTVAIGAPNNNSGKGVTRIYKLTGNVWTRLGTTDISGVDVNEQSGTSVSLSADGTTVAIGAYGNNGSKGVTRIHKLTGNVWTRLGTTDISGVDVNEYSGKSVSLSADGTTVSIGAYGNNGSKGVTRIYKLTGNVWTRLGTTDISGVDVNEQSGKIVSLSADGTTVAIGAPNNNSGKGVTRIYKIDTSGNITYTSSNSSVADIYGNLLLIKGVNGTSNIVATQGTTTTTGTLTVAGTTTYRLVYGAIGGITCITLNTCIWNQLDASASATGRWLAGGTRNDISTNTIPTSASLYISTDASGAASPWTPITGTGAILSQVYSIAYNGRVWIAAGVAATDVGSTSTLMRTTDPSGASGWQGIAATNVSTGGFDTAARSIAWNADQQMWFSTGENTATSGTGSAVDASFSTVIYSQDVSGSAGTWRSVRESNSLCFSGEGTGIAFTGDKWFASGQGTNQIVATAGTSAASAATGSWTSIAHGTALTSASDIAYTGRRLIATGASTSGTSNGVFLSTDNSGGSWSAAAATPGPGFTDASGGATSITFEASYDGVGRAIATGRSATNTLSVSTDGGTTWAAPSVQYSSSTYLYENYGPITARTTTVGFPILNTLPNWIIDISFISTGGASTYRPLLGSMYNSVDTARGWGIWVGHMNQIHYSHNNTTYDSFVGNVSLNVGYNLNVTKVGTSVTLRLTTVSNQTVLTNTITVTDAMGIGPVDLYGFSNGELFIGTIGYVIVTDYSNSAPSATTQPLFTTGGNSVAYVGNDTIFLGGGNDVQWTGKRWVATGRTSGGVTAAAPVSSTASGSAPLPDIINNNTSAVATSDDGITWQCVSSSQAPNLSEGTFLASNSRIGATPLINSQIAIADGGDTEATVDYGGMVCDTGGSGTGVAQIDIIAELTPVSNAASSVVLGAVNILGAAGNGGANGVGNAQTASFDNTAFTITTRPI